MSVILLFALCPQLNLLSIIHTKRSAVQPCLSLSRDRERLSVLAFFPTQFCRASWYPAYLWVDPHLSPKPENPAEPRRESGVGV